MRALVFEKGRFVFHDDFQFLVISAQQVFIGFTFSTNTFTEPCSPDRNFLIETLIQKSGKLF